MFTHKLEEFSHRLILGEHYLITSDSVFKRAVLTGYLSILVLFIGIFYIIFDAYLGTFNALPYYFTLICFAVLAFSLNRTGRYSVAKMILLASTLLIIFVFSATEPVDNGNYFNFFPLTIAAFALFDYKDIYKGIIFTLISIGAFIIVYFYEMPLLPIRPTSEGLEVTNFLVHYLISILASVLIIIFLIKLNQNIESNLIRKDKNLIKITDELKASKQRFELAIQGSNAGIYDWDIEHNKIYHAPMWKKLLGYGADELEGFNIDGFYEFIHPKDRERIKHTLKNHLINGRTYSVELRLRTRDGLYEWFSDAGQAIWDNSGKPVRMVGSIIRIHERKLAEERIRKQNQMLEKTNLELDNFVYSASHDLRAPLTSILGLINIAEKSKNKKEIFECLYLMKDRIHRLDEFTEDILDFSKNIRTEKTLREINLNYLIEEVIKNHDLCEDLDKIDIQVSIANDFEVISDPFRLKVILKNLFSNACKFSDLRSESSWLRISALRENEHFLLIIEDNGEGIRAELLHKIFDIFFRASERSKGSGIGLYIVKEMINKLNGTITVNSIYGKGTQIVIELPDHKFSQELSDVKLSQKIKIN